MIPESANGKGDTTFSDRRSADSAADPDGEPVKPVENDGTAAPGELNENVEDEVEDDDRFQATDN